MELRIGDSQMAKNFQKLIRKYNNSFSFVSLAANLRAPPGHGPPCFHMYRQLHDRYGARMSK